MENNKHTKKGYIYKEKQTLGDINLNTESQMWIEREGKQRAMKNERKREREAEIRER